MLINRADNAINICEQGISWFRYNWVKITTYGGGTNVDLKH